MSLLLACLAGISVTAPHLLRLEGAAPAPAAAIWLAALCLRALIAVFIAVFVILYLPTTALFDLATHWCWHAVVPLMATHLGLNGHDVGDAALLAPSLTLAASLGSVSLGLWRAARSVRTWIRRMSVGPGPQQSLIVGEHDVVVAAAGLRRPQIIVSAGALTAFDDEELAASLAHERGHIAHRHHVVLLIAEMCRSLARFLPGTRRAMAELVFHLERDADRWAVGQRHDPAALASAICKAALRRAAGAVLALSGRGVTRRVRQLLDARRTPPRRQRYPCVVAGSMIAVVLALAAALPSATLAGVQQAATADAVRHCQG